MKSDKPESFSFGASFVPYAKSEDMPMSMWEDDMKMMKKMGFNTIRSFVAWDRIERQEGVYDFKKLDYIFELAEQYDMNVILNVGGAFSNLCGIYPPRWIIRDYKCQHVTEAPGALDGKPFGPRRFICMDDPVYIKKSEVFMRKAIERYKTQKRLQAWSVWNEPILGYPCLCKHTMAEFRKWLKTKYNNDLSLLNELWGSEFPVDYVSWDEVEPGLEAGFGGGYLPAFDWITFNEEKIANHVGRISKLVKQLDPFHPTTINIITSADRKPIYFNNIFALGSTVDIVGYSHYLYNYKPYECAANLDIIRSTTKSLSREYWIIETEAGPMRYFGDFYSGSGDNGKREKAHWQSVGHGVKSILLWKYRGRISDKQTDEYTLMGWDGSMTKRAEFNSKCAIELQKTASCLNDKVSISEIAIFHSDASRKYVNLDDGSLEIEERWQDSLMGAYKVLWDLNFSADFVSETEITEGNLFKYKLLIIPMGVIVTAPVAEQLREFVEAGGHILADYFLAAKKENCRINYRAPGNCLDKIFGCYYNDVISADANNLNKITLIDSDSSQLAMTCSEVACELSPYEGAEIKAVYDSGTPALVKNDFGLGTAWLCGSTIFADYCNGKNPQLYDFVDLLTMQSGIRKKFEVNADYDQEKINNIEINELTEKLSGERLLVIVNHNEDEVTFELDLKSDSSVRVLNNILEPEKSCRMKNNKCKIKLKAFESIIMDVEETAFDFNDCPKQSAKEEAMSLT